MDGTQSVDFILLYLNVGLLELVQTRRTPMRLFRKARPIRGQYQASRANEALLLQHVLASSYCTNDFTAQQTLTMPGIVFTSLHL